MASMDVFKTNAFSMVELTDAINKRPYQPTFMQRLGVFTEKSTRLTRVMIEQREGSLELVPTTLRGAPPIENLHNLRNVRDFNIPHIALSDKIYADEIQGVRAWGSETELQSMQAETNLRFDEMNAKIQATKEYHMVGAWKGIILDADGSSVIYNLFNEFNVTQTEVDFDLGDTSTNIREKCEEVRAAMQTALGAEGGDDIQVLALVGSTWWNKFISHPNVAGIYDNYARGMNIFGSDPLANDLRFRGFTFGDITFRVYRGQVGGVSFISASEGHAAPMGFEMFRCVYAPAPMMQFVNTPGAPLYTSTIIDPSGQDKYVELNIETNPFCYCRRVDALVKLTTST